MSLYIYIVFLLNSFGLQFRVRSIWKFEAGTRNESNGPFEAIPFSSQENQENPILFQEYGSAWNAVISNYYIIVIYYIYIILYYIILYYRMKSSLSRAKLLSTRMGINRISLSGVILPRIRCDPWVQALNDRPHIQVGLPWNVGWWSCEWLTCYENG